MGLRGDAFDRSLAQAEMKLKGTVNAFEFAINGQITNKYNDLRWNENERHFYACS